MLIDAHCHIDMCKEPAEKVVAGDILIVTNGTNLQSNKKVLAYAEMFPNVRAAMGLYPSHAIENSAKENAATLKFIEKNKKKIIAVGEVGIDFYHIKDSKDQKKEINEFKKLIQLANKIKKPLIVHSRKAINESMDLLKAAKVPVVMHCFEGNALQTEEAIKRGYYCTIPANFWTRKGFKNTARRVPIDRLITETDSPWLSPIEGENRPQNVKYAISRLAELKEMSDAQVRIQIWQNFVKVFNIQEKLNN
jgi:TatD DNase family protein